MLILYPASLLNWYISSISFFVDPLAFPIYEIMSSVNRNGFSCFLGFFSYLIPWLGPLVQCTTKVTRIKILVSFFILDRKHPVLFCFFLLFFLFFFFFTSKYIRSWFFIGYPFIRLKMFSFFFF